MPKKDPYQVLKEPLEDYQVEAVKWVHEFYKNECDPLDRMKPKGLCLGDGTGVGKSPTSLAAVHVCLSKTKASFVVLVCPTKIKKAWLLKLNQFLPKKRAYKIALITYEELKDPVRRRSLIQHKPDFTIFDEGHYVKTHTSLRTLASVGSFYDKNLQNQSLAWNSKFILYLTATPMPSRIGELYTMLWSMRVPEIRKYTYNEFIEKFSDKFRVFKDKVIHEGLSADAPELKAIIKKYFLRRKLEDVRGGKDPREWFTNFIDLDLEKMAENEEVLAELQELILNTRFSLVDPRDLVMNPELLQEVLNAVPSFEKMTTFRRLQALAKVPQVTQQIKNLYGKTNTRPFVVSTVHRESANEYFENFKAHFKRRRVHYIDGTMPADDRYDLLHVFNKSQHDILVTTMGSIREGLDLNLVNECHITELEWVPGWLEQFEGRFFRFNTPLGVRIKFWYYPGSDGMDKYMLEKLAVKRKAIETLFKGTMSA